MKILSIQALRGPNIWSVNRKINIPSSTSPQPTAFLSKFQDLLNLPVSKLPTNDIAQLNLLCAQGLPGSGDFDVKQCMDTLSEMTERVRAETTRNHYRFERSPGDFENSENFYKMVILAVVLGEDFHITYAANKIMTVADARTDDGFFADAHDVFLHGLLGSRRQGTCSSLPVLQVAIGRRLGYPLKLVTTKSHLFVRWEDSFEHFNIEASGNGVNRFSDDYYRHWPLEVSDAEIQAEGYLKSLSSSEELAVFLSIRGMCWRDAHDHKQAAECFRLAAKLNPACLSYTIMGGRHAAGD